MKAHTHTHRHANDVLVWVYKSKTCNFFYVLRLEIVAHLFSHGQKINVLPLCEWVNK